MRSLLSGRPFLSDRRGNFAMLFAASLVPIMGGIALTVDYTAASSQRQATLMALDAAGVATARYITKGGTDAQTRAYAKSFFEANLDGQVDPKNVTLNVTLPTNEAGGGTLKLTADLIYKPYFYSPFKHMLIGADDGKPDTILVGANAEIRLKNTLEVALVLDNSGSMSDPGNGSGQKRIDLLKSAAKQLVDTLALQSSLMKQVEKPVQFSLVPFAASVNVGPQNAGASWMDTEGVSPIHHENFDWSGMSSGERRAVRNGAGWQKAGTAWGATEGQPLTRFSLYNDMRHVSSREWVVTGREYVCTRTRSNGTCSQGNWQDTGFYNDTVTAFSSWQGCVEARPSPYNTTDAPASPADPASLFVPMFAPDEPGDRWDAADDPSRDNFSAANNWWNDGNVSGGATRLKSMKKYFDVRPYGATSPQGSGPNYSCTTAPLTELVDVSQPEGLAAIKTAIDGMAPNGATNVPEGLAWGWRTLSSGEPFTGGRPDSERGNDKVVIVLTDGANTYYTPSSLGYSDPADSKSTYSAYGYMKPAARLFGGTSSAIGQFDYSNANYSSALNEQMAKICANAKQQRVMVMTVALDLNSSNAIEAAQIAALRTCSSDSRFRKDSADPSKPAKLFWNATGSNLADKFKEIADELSNLRIVG